MMEGSVYCSSGPKRPLNLEKKNRKELKYFDVNENIVLLS